MSEEEPQNGGGKLTIKNYVNCACSGGAGLLVGHLGCIATPLMFAALGVTGVAVSSPLIAIGVGAAITAGGLGAWYKLRGRFAKAAEKKIVVASAIAGLALMSVFNLTSGHHDHDGPEHRHDHGAPTEKTDPHKAHHGHPGRIVPPPLGQTQIWLDSLDPEKRQEIEDNAARIGISTDEYLDGMCGLLRLPAHQP